MSKTKIYFTILAAIVIVVAIGYIMNINAITYFFNLCLGFAGQNILSVSAAVCAFVFLGNKNYWLIMFGCAVVASLLIQVVIVGQNAGIVVLAARTATFLAIVFLMNFVKLLINK